MAAIVNYFEIGSADPDAARTHLLDPQGNRFGVWRPKQPA
jgi:predicted enzyme related to lactoylglutathione lyase